MLATSCIVTQHRQEKPDCSLYFPIRYQYTWIRSPWAFFSSGCTIPTLSTSPHMKNAILPKFSLWYFSGLSSVCLCLFCICECRDGPRSHCAWAEGEGHFPLLAANAFPYAAQGGAGEQLPLLQGTPWAHIPPSVLHDTMGLYYFIGFPSSRSVLSLYWP